ncbi:MAG: SpoIIE family protein phosphatase [Pirellulales bacterium]
MPVLKLLDGPVRVPDLKVRRDVARIGKRLELCGRYTLPDDRVSGLHCTIEWRDDGYFIVDRGSANAGSKNGTEVNSLRLDPLRPYPLKNGDLVTIARVFRFEYRDDDSESFSGKGDSVVVDQRSDGSRVSLKLPAGMSGAGETAVATSISRLNLITQMIESLRRDVKLEPRCDHVLETLAENLPACDRGLLWIPRHHGLKSGLVVARCRRDTLSRPNQNTIPPDVYQAVFEEGCAVQTEGRQMLCAPLLDRHNRVLGCIQLESLDERRPFGTHDLDLLRTAAHLIAFAVDVALLELVEREMEEGRRILDSLLPTKTPVVAGYDFYKFYQPASFVGGDYFDFIPLSDGRLAIPVGDVSGKQLPASLFMTKVSGELRAMLDIGLPLTEILERLNRRICDQDEKTVTLLLLTLDPRTHEVCLVNAGHCLPWRRNAKGEVSELGGGRQGCILGGIESWKYEELRTTLGPGEALVLYTDGCTDAENELRQRYHVPENPRLRHAIESGPQDLTALCDYVREDIERFVGDQDQFDDMCLVGIRRW